MDIILFSHPDFLDSQSMPRYSKMLADGFSSRGHTVEIWKPTPRFYKFSNNKAIGKWLGYIDQYLIFPLQVKRKLKKYKTKTFFVLTDNALGPWVPLVAGRPHVIHCHDFLAQFSALGKLSPNPTSWTGRRYQYFIRKGLKKGKNFISVSNKTKEDLIQFLNPSLSEVVYNGLNSIFIPEKECSARKELSTKTGIDLNAGYILHVGGNQWYKNRLGVIEIYEACRLHNHIKVPLLLIGEPPSEKILKKYNAATYKSDIYFITNADDSLVQKAYSGASVFLFPSLMEGFGWPIAEAMACGSPVVTTNETPMTEVAGAAAFLIKRMPFDGNIKLWAKEAAIVISKIFLLSPDQLQSIKNKGFKNIERFNLNKSLDNMERIYQSIINNSNL